MAKLAPELEPEPDTPELANSQIRVYALLLSAHLVPKVSLVDGLAGLAREAATTVLLSWTQYGRIQNDQRWTTS